MTYLGEDTFKRGMASYFARHAWGNTTLQDLVDELADRQRPRPRHVAREVARGGRASTC